MFYNHQTLVSVTKVKLFQFLSSSVILGKVKVVENDDYFFQKKTIKTINHFIDWLFLALIFIWYALFHMNVDVSVLSKGFNHILPSALEFSSG
jgi:hypothetical protein